jgi:hypothetical protein
MPLKSRLRASTDGNQQTIFGNFSQKSRVSLEKMRIGLYNPLDGVTNPQYKLLHFLTLTFFYKEKKAPDLNWDRCCHLALCLWLILFQ